MPRSSIRCDTVGTVSDFVLVGTVSDFVLVGTVSDFVLGSYVPFSKPKTKSDTAHSPKTKSDTAHSREVLVLGEKHSPAHASVEHVENRPPPGECRLGRDIHAFLPRYPS